MGKRIGSPLDRALRAAMVLEDDDLLKLHRAVCSQAARIYAPRYAAKQRTGYITALNFRRALAKAER